MASNSEWRAGLGAVERYENIEKLKKSIEINGLSSTGTAMKTAFAAETDAYNNSTSRAAYDAACDTIISPDTTTNTVIEEPHDSGISIGSYLGCHHIASGLVSEVYRSKAVALKVITETHDVEPHNPHLEIKILQSLSHSNIIPLQTTFRDQSSHLVLVFPYQPFTLAKLLASPLPLQTTKAIFKDLFSALLYLHKQDIIHRDVKPSNLLLASPTGPTLLSDFGTTYHPVLSAAAEPASHKVLEVGTTCYRAPETLFGNRAYTTSLDIWAAGTMLAECLRSPPAPLFESRSGEEDGNQLGLILSMFKTLGTPTRESWPEAEAFTTPPFDWYREFPGKSWGDLLPGVDEGGRELVEGMVRYESGSRMTAEEVLNHIFFKDER